MSRKTKWFHSLRVRISLVILLIVLLLEASGGLSLYYFGALNNAVKAQAEQKLPTLRVLNETQLGITRLANLSSMLSRSESPAHSRILMAQVTRQANQVKLGLDALGEGEQVQALKQIVASVVPSMARISIAKDHLDQAEHQLGEKLAQAIRLTTGAIVGAQDKPEDLAKLNILLINLSQLLTADTHYAESQIISTIETTMAPFAAKAVPTHVYLRLVILGEDGVAGALEQRAQYRAEMHGLDTQNRILLGNVVDFGQRVYDDMQDDIVEQARRTSEQATLFAQFLVAILVLQLIIALLLIVFLHKQLFKRLQALHGLVSRQKNITSQDLDHFDERNEVGALVKQLQQYLSTIHQQQQQIALTSQQLQTVIKHSQMKVAVMDHEHLLYCSESLRQIFLEHNLSAVEDFPQTLIEQLRIAEAGQIKQLPEAYFDRLHQRWYDITLDAIYWNGQASLLVSFIDATERVQAAQQYEKTLIEVESEAYIDPLTRLFNRKMFDRQVTLYDANAQQPMAVLLFDVDHFKGYNDRLGHLQGDKVLQMVANVIQRNTPTNGLAIRYGGEEFVVLLPATEAELAVNIAQTIIEDVYAQEVPHPTSPHQFLSLSCGVSVSCDSSEALLNIFDQADKSLYKAKHCGRNCVLLNKQAA
ncbi:sensor domain-containing diguanylate cyclase [Marinomonas ostreistagni]|uniref:GGDEF domain-containing protein n=1 Tax=Marinomonas ostreistagni TaxID=359209 RepID=UPI0019507A5A|nr:GGDEF domain-containing protein [Marinomonas ostreistagni]MBM6552015.1 GGDEF domain-containing protein [Marinomonas ostreistagni]